MRQLRKGLSFGALLGMVGWLVVGCTTTPRVRGQEPDVEEPFPEKQELENIESSEEPTSFFQERREQAETWELEGPLPERLGVIEHEPETPFEEILARQADQAGGDVVASQGMHCLAREVGHFYLEKGAFPSGNLRDFMRTRCGAVPAKFGNVWWNWDQPPAVSDKRVARQWKNQGNGVARIKKAMDGEHRSVGIWYGKNEDGAVLLTTVGQRAVDLEPTALDVDGGEPVVLEGETHRDFEMLDAIRTKSAFGFDRCEMDRAVELPKFRIRCEPDGEVGPTRIELLGYLRQRGIGHGLFGNTIWRGEQAAKVYRPSKASRAVARAYQRLGSEGGGESSDTEAENGSTAEGADGESGESKGDELGEVRKFVELVNMVREEAGLQPATFARNQSASTHRLADEYFKAAYKSRDSKRADRIALGLMAGWEVDADIMSGGLASRAVQSERIEVLLQRLVSTASGRQVLFEPEYSQMAVGLTKPSDREALGAIVTAYRELPNLSHDERVAKAFETLNRRREQEGVDPIERDTSLDGKLRQIARKVETGTMEFARAQRRAMAVAAQMWGTRVSSVGMLASSLEDYSLHSDLASGPVERAAVMVVPYKDPDLAWTPYIVLAVFPEMSGEMAAAPGLVPDSRRASRLRPGRLAGGGAFRVGIRPFPFPEIID
jgi:hypothetical protein